jgi:hypothetical protein
VQAADLAGVIYLGDDDHVARIAGRGAGIGQNARACAPASGVYAVDLPGRS